MGEVAARFLQAGLETTKGTDIAATRVLMARLTNPSFNQPREFVEEDRGSLVGAARFIGGVKDYGFSIEQEGATFEEFGWFAATAIKGSVVATTVNTTGKQYIYAPTVTPGTDDLQAARIEFGDNTQAFECGYCEGTGFTLGFDTLTAGQAAPLALKVDYVTSSLTSNTKTPGLTPPTVETILGTGGTFYLDATSVAFGSLAAVSTSLRSFNLTYANNLGRKVFVGDGTTYTAIGRGRRQVTFDCQFEGNATGVTRFVEWDLATEKRMKLIFGGTIITGSSPATTKKLQLQGRVVFTSFDPIGEVDTNTVFSCSGRFLPDSALSVANTDIEFMLTNDVASYT